MKNRVVLAIFCLATLLCVAAETRSQTKPQPVNNVEVQSPPVSNGQTPSPSQMTQKGNSVDIMYTGKLLGYFRVPSLQSRDQVGCLKRSGDDSPAAKRFREIREKHSNAILIGTGDNFAPQLEARIFGVPSKNDKPDDTRYHIENKELYLGDTNGWVPYNEASSTLEKRIREGNGTIPADNVGCFLRAEGFKAIVPGKHDFYFGAERVRQYARLLANPNYSGNPVQMLGANLVIKTSPIDSVKTPDYVKNERNFDDWPKEITLANLKDGKTVYPWFSGIKIKLAKQPSGLSFDEIVQTLQKGSETLDSLKILLETKYRSETQLSELRTTISSLSSFWLCNAERDPNDLDRQKCKELTNTRVSWEEKTTSIQVDLPERVTSGTGFFSTLETGNNFLLCTNSQPANSKNKYGCMRFSTHIPFFYFPHHAPQQTSQNNNSYTDPDPYVLDKEKNIAIFGIVDPNLGEQVGILNFGWKNQDGDLTTKVSVEDPVEALLEQLDYFTRKEPTFTGLKILLAQTTPQGARALTAKFPDFQVVVSGADQEQATSELKTSTKWIRGVRSAGAFLAVPTPYYDVSQRKGFVYTGMIHASEELNQEKNVTGNWDFNSEVGSKVEVTEPEDTAIDFWTRIEKLEGCRIDTRPDESKEKDKKTYLKWLVLCSMQKYLGADVALIQTRDLFDFIPKLKRGGADYSNRAKGVESSDSTDLENIQQMLDRLIWKGDLVTLLHVPGKALKKALDKSDTFDAAEKSSLALSVERGRTLETLGIRKTKDGEYYINELLVEDNKLYAVATTDYIGAGDTGYPDLVKDAINPRTHPRAFTENFLTVSSLACKQLFRDEKDQARYCLSELDRDKYLDGTVAEQTPPYRPANYFRNLWDSVGITWPKEEKSDGSISQSVERKVRRRSFWNYSLKGASLTFNNLNKNLSDKEVTDKFAGVTSTEVTAKESVSLDTSLDNRLSYSGYKREFFVGGGFNYKKVSTGDETEAPNSIKKFSQTSYQQNRVFGETGYIFWRRPGREIPNIGLSVSLYAETQLLRPSSVFSVASGDEIKIPRGRSLMLLPRLGIRWQNKVNFAEVGLQRGRELNVLKGYEFATPGGPFPCPLVSTKTFKKCIADNPAITKDTPVIALLQDSPRAGFYWKGHVTIPIHSQVSFELDEEGDFFMENSLSTSADTRRREMTKIKLGFIVFPNLTIGPTLNLLRFRNQVNKDFLFQHTFGAEIKWAFDIYNRREKGVQVTHKLK